MLLTIHPNWFLFSNNKKVHVQWSLDLTFNK